MTGRRDTVRFVRVRQDDSPAVPPGGALIVGLAADGIPVTGGAVRRYGEVHGELTAELKRIWTARQPEAERLYRAAGYTRLDAPLPAHGPGYPVAVAKAVLS
jgi:hypothetical protein